MEYILPIKRDCIKYIFSTFSDEYFGISDKGAYSVRYANRFLPDLRDNGQEHKIGHADEFLTL